MKNLNAMEFIGIRKVRNQLNRFKLEPLMLFFGISLVFGLVALFILESTLLRIIDYFYIVLNIFLVLVMSFD